MCYYFQMEELRKKFEGVNFEDVKQLKEQIDSERNKMAGIMNSWLAEVIIPLFHFLSLVLF